MRTIFLFLTLAASIPAWSVDSAYTRLRKQFWMANTPSVEQLQLNKTWFCSGSMEAAKGLFRSVAIWEPTFRFKKDDHGEIKNVGYRGKDSVVGRRWQISHSRGLDFLRVNEAGDILVEVTHGRSSTQIYKYLVEYVNAFSDPQRDAILYFICENPVTHDNPDWYKGDIWSTDDN